MVLGENADGEDRGKKRGGGDKKRDKEFLHKHNCMTIAMGCLETVKNEKNSSRYEHVHHTGASRG